MDAVLELLSNHNARTEVRFGNNTHANFMSQPPKETYTIEELLEITPKAEEALQPQHQPLQHPLQHQLQQHHLQHQPQQHQPQQHPLTHQPQQHQLQSHQPQQHQPQQYSRRGRRQQLPRTEPLEFEGMSAPKTEEEFAWRARVRERVLNRRNLLITEHLEANEEMVKILEEEQRLFGYSDERLRELIVENSVPLYVSKDSKVMLTNDCLEMEFSHIKDQLRARKAKAGICNELTKPFIKNPGLSSHMGFIEDYSAIPFSSKPQTETQDTA